MDILRCVPSAGLLKVIQANSPHMLQHDQVETLWERFCKKEFSYLLRLKIEAHKKEFGESNYFPIVPWEEVYDTLAHEEFLRLQADTAQLASRTMQLNQERTAKQTTLLADPRMLIKARVKGAPGARSALARGPRSAVQKAAEETRQLAMQRRQAIANASKPATKINVAPKGLLDTTRKSDRVIKAPVKKMGQKRALEDLRDKRQEKSERRSATPSPAQSNDNKSTASSASTTTMMTAAAKTVPPVTPKKPAPAPARMGGLFASSKPWMLKGMPPTETKNISSNGDGTVTISVTVDWSSPRNKQILEFYTPAEKAAALSKPARTTTVTATEYKKRGSHAISSDRSTGTSTSTSTSASPSASTSATSPSADGEDTARLVQPPSKRRKVMPTLFMPPKVVARPRTQD